MGNAFPGESPEYRAERDRLLEQEAQLRRAVEEVATARRRLPPGGVVPEDYVFEGLAGDGTVALVRLSELFLPGKDSRDLQLHVPARPERRLTRSGHRRHRAPASGGR